MTTTGRRRAEIPRPRTRDRIISAAIELFGEHGYEGTSIMSIAERVGLSDAGVLYHFSTKRELFAAVVDAFAAAQVDSFRAFVEPGGLAAIRNLRRWGEVMEARPDLLALQVVLSAEAISPDAELHTYWASRHVALLALLGDLFRQAIADGEVRRDLDVEFEASALAAHLDGMRLQWFYSGRTRSIARSFDHYVGALVDRISLEPDDPTS